MEYHARLKFIPADRNTKYLTNLTMDVFEIHQGILYGAQSVGKKDMLCNKWYTAAQIQIHITTFT